MSETIENGMKKVLIPCPDGRPGCLVAHFKWVPVEETETNAERLERFKLKHSISLEINDELKWLIEQAEQVEIWKDISKTFEQAALNYESENKRLREALEYISNTWSIGLTYQWHVEEFQDKAKQALEVSE